MVRTGSVLVVDDDPLLCEVVSEGLGQAGFEVFTAADGAVALRHLAVQLPDLIVLDMLMPNMDGVEALREVKARYPEVPVIAISGGTNTLVGADLLLRMASSLGADALMTKPLKMPELVGLAKGLVRRGRPPSQASARRAGGPLDRS